MGAITGGLTAGLQAKYGSAPDPGSQAAKMEHMVRDTIGKLWTLPNTIIGLVAGALGYGFGLAMGMHPEIHFGDNGIEFFNNPFAFAGGITIGNVMIFGGDPTSSDPGYAGMQHHESQHTIQAQVLGPLYLPLAALSLAAGTIFNFNPHGPADFLERGPQQQPPRPW